MIKFENNEVTPSWNSHKSFKYSFKGNFDFFNNTIRDFKNYRDNNNALNKNVLTKKYTFDEYNPLVVENVFCDSFLKMIQNYYSTNIKNKVYALGDKQSNRYKGHNEPMSRFLQYEILPLIEHVVGSKLEPTYTYLSCYVKGSDLPAHTDRPECQYTVSFMIDKPDGLEWPIYVDKRKEPIKFKGRYRDYINSDNIEHCIPVDCNAGGIMMFNGTDHIHFREHLTEEYCNIALLHYRKI